jgi:hypothetical protein
MCSFHQCSRSSSSWVSSCDMTSKPYHDQNSKVTLGFVSKSTVNRWVNFGSCCLVNRND